MNDKINKNEKQNFVTENKNQKIYYKDGITNMFSSTVSKFVGNSNYYFKFFTWKYFWIFPNFKINIF